MQEVYPEVGGTGRRIGLLTGTEGGGAGEDAAAEQHAPGPIGQGGRDQRGDAEKSGAVDEGCGRGPGEAAVGCMLTGDKVGLEIAVRCAVVDRRLWAGASSPSARSAPHGPFRSAISHGVDQHFRSFVVHHEGDDGFPPGRDGTQSGEDFGPEASLVRRLPQGGESCLNLRQLPRRDLRPGVVEDPSRDGVKVPRDERVETDAVAHAPRAASIEARAVAKASS